MPYANNKGADQPPRSLISAFVVLCLDGIIPLVSMYELSSLYLASVAAQAGLYLPWSQTLKTGFLVTRLIQSRQQTTKALVRLCLCCTVPWINPQIRRKIRRKNKTHAKAKKTGSSKLRTTLRREIKADVREQHDLYVNNLVGDVQANPRDFYRYINSQKKDTQGIPPLKKEERKWGCAVGS